MLVRWTPAAADDLEQVATYLKQHHPEYAEATVERLYAVAESLSEFAMRGRPGRQPGTSAPGSRSAHRGLDHREGSWCAALNGARWLGVRLSVVVGVLVLDLEKLTSLRPASGLTRCPRVNSRDAKYMRRHPRPPSQAWRTFLTNHASHIMAADFLVVPAVTFRLLFVLVEQQFSTR